MNNELIVLSGSNISNEDSFLRTDYTLWGSDARVTGVFTGYWYEINERIFHPILILSGPSKGSWMLAGVYVSLHFLSQKCSIPDDEIILLRLKYGNGLFQN